MSLAVKKLPPDVLAFFKEQGAKWPHRRPGGQLRFDFGRHLQVHNSSVGGGGLCQLGPPLVGQFLCNRVPSPATGVCGTRFPFASICFAIAQLRRW